MLVNIKSGDSRAVIRGTAWLAVAILWLVVAGSGVVDGNFHWIRYAEWTLIGASLIGAVALGHRGELNWMRAITLIVSLFLALGIPLNMASIGTGGINGSTVAYFLGVASFSLLAVRNDSRSIAGVSLCASLLLEFGVAYRAGHFPISVPVVIEFYRW